MAKTQVATTNTTLSANVASEAPAKAPTKMALAKPLFDSVMAMPEDKLEGKTRRRIFMDRAAAELDMKAPGANTYFQNLKNEAETGHRYAYSPASKAQPAQEAAPVTGDAALHQQIDKLTTKVTALNRTVNKLVKGIEHAAHA